MIRSAISERVRDAVWRAPARAPEDRRMSARELVRLFVVLVRDLADGELNLRAMSLAFMTLLAIVPLLALGFSVLKAFGLYLQLEPLLQEFLAPLGEKGAEIAAQAIEFLQNLKVGVLGSVGLALLAYAAVSLVQKMEAAFNFIWQISRPRRFAERFTRYLGLLLVGPLLAFSALGITAAVMDLELVRELLALEPLGPAVFVAGRLVPYLLVIGAFTFAYAFIPNAKVRFGAALAGGAVGGALWQSAGWAFAEFVVASGRYTMVYAGFAILVLFMIWVYLSWIVLLLGASVAFYCQHPQYLLPQGRSARLSNRMRERFALGVMYRVAERHLAGGPAASREALSREFRVPPQAAQLLLDALKQAGLLAHTGDEPPGYLPARDLAQIPVAEVLRAVRSAGETRYLAPARLAVPSQVECALGRLDASAAAALDGVTLRDLVAQAHAETGTAQAPAGAAA
ncbi:MAG: YihY family inner membrane protein [Burkholderiales bacterium]|nr:YihY family inner membrane protein [Burkholderiales bacterium]